MTEEMPQRSANVLRAALCVALSLSGHQALSQQTGATVNPRFKDYDFIQFITSSDLAPSNILHLDNNGDIVLAARQGTTRAELRTHDIPFTESQIALLKTYRLLDETQDTLRTTFPILGPEATRKLRDEVQAVAPTLARRIAPQVRQLRDVLRETGRTKNAYSILFSYVLDGLVWDALERRQVLPPRKITAEQPLWSGQVWAVYPPRSFSPGTNSMSDHGVALKVTWTEGAIPRMVPFVADIPTLGRLLDDFENHGAARDARVRQVFGPFDLFDAAGHFTVPVIDERASNALYRSARAIAADVAAQAPGLLDLSRLVSDFGFRDREQALVVAYHELMWDLMDQLEELGLAEKPVAFAAPQQARPADISALVFIVKGPQ
jgi:hypothetical protein